MEKLYPLFLKSSGANTDTRSLKKGELFFALKGGNFDGNKYALQAIADGALAAVVDDPSLKNEANCHFVPNVLEALQALARHHRQQLGIPILAITGSNGKTTTKELCHAVLASQKKTKATIGNFNNHIGVPLTLLQLKAEDEISIVEMGANHLEEIAFLCGIAEPNVGLITNVGRAHIEGFGSLENIHKGKGELFAFLKEKDAPALVNRRLDYLVEQSKDQKRELFPSNESALSQGFPFLSFVYNGKTVKTNLVGDYNYDNALSAIAVGEFFNIPEENILSAIEAYQPTNMRSQFVKAGNWEFIMDAYNANPSSMKAALKNLESVSDKNVSVVLGDMLELGSEEEQAHLEILECLTEMDLKNIFLVGPRFEKACDDNPDLGLSAFATTDEMVELFSSLNPENDLVLVKGSRGMRLEKLLEALN